MWRRKTRKEVAVVVVAVVVVVACMAGGAEGQKYHQKHHQKYHHHREDPSLYNIGVGIYDVTGPAAGVNMMGYANPAQINNGIHMRLFSRAFIVDDGKNRVVFVSVDCGMMGSLIKTKVLEKLQETYGLMTYTAANLILSGTHTHSGPGGFLQHLLFDITSLGFIQSTFDAMVEGIFQSIKQAHEGMVPGHLYMVYGHLLDASINRSPTSYLNNPPQEREKYQYDTDKRMTLLKLVAHDGTPLGMVNWFAVHPTSMNNTNTLVTGDNKGYASQLFEEVMNPGAMPGKGKFVAAFAQSNCGDVSPNIKGAHCIDTGLPCEMETSTCNGKVQMCIASGPGRDMVESTKIIGTRQFSMAMNLFNSSKLVKVSGPVLHAQQFVDMSRYNVDLADGKSVSTCLPALGYSFAAGTTDGPGAFDFTQGTTEGNPFWNMISGLLHKPSQQQIDCHAPKPILLDTGELNIPYPWHPRIMDTQVALVGQLAILPVPGEFTTMCGRRLREKIVSVLTENGMEGVVPVLAGLSNEYSHYITTWEEYQMQRYEAASTIFGPHTCAAYRQQYTFLAKSILSGTEVPLGPSPPDMSGSVLSLLPPVLYDRAPLHSNFGDVVAQPYPLAYIGETVMAKFVSGHPRNDPQLGGSFLTVERQVNSSVWEVVATDANWETRFIWERVSVLLGTSLATVKWDIPSGTPEGKYRITHTGHSKNFLFGISAYTGTTDTFEVTMKPDTTKLEFAEEPQERNSGSALPIPWWLKIF